MSSSSFAPLAFPEVMSRGSDELAERARVHGHAAGYAAGRRVAAAELERDRVTPRAEAERALVAEIAGLRAAQAALERAAGLLDARAATAMVATKDDLLGAAIDLATVILGRELQDGEGSAVAAVRRVLEAPDGAQVHAVRMHPLDIEVLAAGAVPAPGVRLVPDAGLGRGDAVGELEDGLIDARIAAAVERARRAITGGDR